MIKTLVTFSNTPEPKNRQDLISELSQAYMLIQAADSASGEDNVLIHDNELIELSHVRVALKRLLQNMAK